ncbi:Na+/H+ antiporter subunit E [bacterium]|nr:Na+/H+ antiporter subunit E [bacterium]
MTRILRILGMSALFTGIWILLSGKIDRMHLGTGIVTSFILALYYHPRGEGKFIQILRFLVFIPWQLYQIFISNLRVARLVLSRRPAVAPTVTRQRPGVQGDVALTLLGCSITLTPGTLTIEADDDHILVHSLDRGSQEDIRKGVMSKRVRQVFEGKCR